MTIHSCSYYCERPECIKRQRDELREDLAGLESVRRDQAAGRDYWCKEAQTAQSQAAAMAGLLEEARKYVGMWHDDPALNFLERCDAALSTWKEKQ